MAKKLIACFLLSLPIITLAQTEPRIVGYFNKDWKEVQEKDRAVFYRTVEDQPDGLYLVKDYYMSGQLQMQPVICKAYTPKLEWEGNTILYHENGKVKEEGFFKNENRQGLHKYWYSNGKPHKIGWHEGERIEKYHQYWSVNGEELLKNGNGTITEFSETNGNIYYFDVRDSVSIGSYSYNEAVGDTIYFFVEKLPEYNGGREKMYRGISANLKYPASAVRANIEGTVYISFVVDEQGHTIAHQLIKGISSDCDEEALRVVKLLNDWNPGMHRGKPVKVKFILPIKYKLD
jgi:TonB family protein